MKHVSLALLTLCLLGVPSCDKSKPSGDGSASEPASKADAEACSKLSERFCGKVGKEDPTCDSAKLILPLLSDAACAAGLRDFEVTTGKLEKQGKKCDELIQKLCAAVGAETCTMVKEKTKDLKPAHCQAMLGQTDEIIKELKKEEQANQPLNAELQAKIAAGSPPSWGPANAKVTVVEFSDFQCPYCSRAAVVAKQLREKYQDRVRFIFRQFPLSFHDNAKPAARAALAAHAQGKFFEFHDKIFENPQNLDSDSFEGYAKDLKLDLGRFKAALGSKKADDQIEQDLALGGEVAVQGTPSMFVNGKRVGNPTDLDAVSRMIDAALGD